MVVQGAHNSLGTNFFNYLALGLEVDGDDGCDSGLILVVMEYFEQADGLVSAVERYCAFQTRSRIVSTTRLERGNMGTFAGMEEKNQVRCK